jgi:hypothetical protein
MNEKILFHQENGQVNSPSPWTIDYPGKKKKKIGKEYKCELSNETADHTSDNSVQKLSSEPFLCIP